MSKQTHLVSVDERVDKLAQIKFNNFGGSPMAEHNMPCANCVCHPAVIQMTSDKLLPTFQPCWKCQKEGWVTVRATGWRRFLLRTLGLVRR